MSKTNYNRAMSDNFDDYLADEHTIKDFEKKIASYSREEINDLMHEIHNDTEFLMDSYAPPKLIRYYHELLSRLIKTYGH
mgnify:FL=1|jgi:hypothetical protein